MSFTPLAKGRYLEALAIDEQIVAGRGIAVALGSHGCTVHGVAPRVQYPNIIR